VANNESDSVAVLLGNGDGTFPTAIPYGAGGQSHATWAGVGDFNGDGKQDIVASNGCPDVACLTGSVGVLLNTSKLATTTTLASSQNPSPFGQTVTFTATVTGPGGGIPTGTVNFYDSTTSLGSSSLNGSGVATLATSSFAVGTHSITATYNGDTSFGTSTSPVLSQVVQGAVAVLSTGSVNFGDQQVGVVSGPQVVTLQNTGNISLTITSISITGTNAADFAQTNNCGTSVAAGSSCTVSITFTPAAEGARIGTLAISDNAPGSPQTVSLAGTGVGAVLVFNPSTVTFPSQYVGTSGLPQNVTLQNTGNTTMTISSMVATPGDYAATNGCTSSVGPGVSCTIAVFLDPTTSGTRNGTLTVTDNAPGSPHTVSLVGTGQDFSMAASSSASVTVTPGQTASYTISITPGGGFNQVVTFTCSGAPAQSSCTVSPGSLQLNGSSQATVTVSVSTAGGMASLARPNRRAAGSSIATWIGVFGILGLVTIATAPSTKRKRRLVITCVGLLALGMTVSGCGGSGSSSTNTGGGTPPGTYNLTVTGTFASGPAKLAHNANLTLVVQ
jgi:hypothetical protein